MNNAHRRHRFTPPPVEALDSGQRAFYARLVNGPRGRAGDVPMIDEDGTLLGPFAVMSIAPDIGEELQRLGAAVRYATRLDPLVREAAVLLVASRHNCEFEWFAHVQPARRLGLDDAQLARLKAFSVPDGLSVDQTRSLRVVHTMLRNWRLNDSEYADVVAEIGEHELVELVWLTGYYSTLALALAVFAPPVPVVSADSYSGR